MRRKTLRALVALAVTGGLFAGCTAEGGIDTSGDGVKVEGDVDSKP